MARVVCVDDAVTPSQLICCLIMLVTTTVALVVPSEALSQPVNMGHLVWLCGGRGAVGLCPVVVGVLTQLCGHGGCDKLSMCV